MMKSVLSYQSPLVKLFFLLVLAIGSLSVFLFIGSIFLKLLWGFNYLADPGILQNVSDPFVVDANRLLLLFQHIGFFIAPAIIFLYLSVPNPKQFILLSRAIELKDILIVTGIMLFVMPFVNLLITWNEAMHLPEFLSGIENTFRQMEDSAARLTEAIILMDTPLDFFYMMVIVALLPAIGEELIFRGIIQRLFAQQFGNIHAGIWMSAFLFSAMHFQFFGFFPRMFLGAILGYILIYSGNIIYPMIAHFINNFISLLLAYLIHHGFLGEEIESIGGQQEWFYILPGLLTSIILFYILWKQRSIPLQKLYIEKQIIE